ncbi:MAG: hypothetical protein V4673_11885 [Pseudomonadota bacterium]
MIMKSIAAPLLVLALASTLAACTPPDEAQTPAAESAPTVEAPAAQTPAEPAATAAPTVPALRALGEAERAETLVAVTDCNLESADSVAFTAADISLAAPSAMKVSGWLKAGRVGSAVEQLALRFESADKTQLWDIPIQAMIVRDDLPASEAGTSASGFEAVVDAGALPAGRYHLYLAYRIDGVLAACDNGRHVAIL